MFKLVIRNVENYKPNYMESQPRIIESFLATDVLEMLVEPHVIYYFNGLKIKATDVSETLSVSLEGATIHDVTMRMSYRSHGILYFVLLRVMQQETCILVFTLTTPSLYCTSFTAKFFLCLIMRHIWRCGSVLESFLTSAVNGGERSAPPSLPSRPP